MEITSQEGRCPNCGVDGKLSYGTVILDGNSLGYPVSCPDCDFTGTEWYNVEFDYFTDGQGNMLNQDPCETCKKCGETTCGNDTEKHLCYEPIND